MSKKLQIKSGFTLIELLLYMGLAVILLGILTNLFVSTMDIKKESEATSFVEQDGRFILSRLIYDANQNGALSIISNYSVIDNNLILNGESLNSSETKISEFSTTELGNTSGKKTVQVKFKLESVTQNPNGPKLRDYQITLGSR